MHNLLTADLDHVLLHTQDVWEELRGQRLFITGGTGFFGCWLLESFAWANNTLGLDASALVLTRDPDTFARKAPHLAADPAIELYVGDVRDFDYPPGRFSHIIHAATEASAKLNNENPLLMLDTIVGGTRRTLDFACHCGARRFLLVSSGAVYGRQPPDIMHVSEDYGGAPSTIDPSSAYGEGKRLAEHLCALYAGPNGLETKIARCFTFVGPYLPLDTNFAIGNFIRDGMRGGPIQVRGDGTPCRSYLYAADLAISLWTILTRGRACRPYNVGSENGMPISEVAHQVAGCFRPEPRVEIAGAPQVGRDPERYVPSVHRCGQELGLCQTIDLCASIERTIRWNRACTQTL